VTKTIASLLILLSAGITQSAEETTRLKELDAYWAEVSRCVHQGDFQGYKATCHEDGVLVSGIREQAYPLSVALKRWEQDFIDAKSGKIEARVEFRFAKRWGDATTAHETGIFLYSQIKADGTRVKEYIHFEALLLKPQDDWKIMMEYQKSSATKEEWDALD